MRAKNIWLEELRDQSELSDIFQSTIGVQIVNTMAANVCSIKQLMGYHLATSGKRLLLPPVQRSVVWSNEQVINYWDSLLRGYPAGMMMIHRAAGREATENQGRDSEGRTVDASQEDLMLFDGQQRMTALLLGLGKGQMARGRKLWVDVGVYPDKSSDLKFQLRMTSTGQPFGYRPDAPNQKIELAERSRKWSEWAGKTPEQVFEKVTGDDIIKATCAIPFATVWEEILSSNAYECIKKFSSHEKANPKIVEGFVEALCRTMDAQVLLQQVPLAVIVDVDEYIRFFARAGQGETRLSDDELSYSIIKNRYPKIHDRMAGIVRGEVGHLADEVDLVLASLRVARSLAPWENAQEWEIVGRPNPTFASELRNRVEVERKFLELVPPTEHGTALLQSALTGVRKALEHGSGHPEGFPSILLGGLPRELIDVLVLFGITRGIDKCWEGTDRLTLRAFVLHWLLFVANDSKAAWITFRHFLNGKLAFQQDNIIVLIDEYEREGAARFLPRQHLLQNLRKQIRDGDHRLRAWVDRFTAADTGSERKPGEALRVLSTNSRLIRRALIWLQRDYIARKFPNYDPTSERDDDLPIDLDHIIPWSHFGFDWRRSGERLDAEVISDNFRWQRAIIGNSLGNYRWLAASENRGRGDRAFDPLPGNDDLVTNPEEWQEFVNRQGRVANGKKWSKDDVAAFQRLIDLRTIELYEKILIESGLAEIFPKEMEGDST